MDPTTRRLRSGSFPGAFGVAVAVVGLVLAMLASSSGVVHLWDPPPPSHHSRVVDGDAPSTQAPAPQLPPRSESQPTDSRVLEIVALAVLTVVAAAALYAVVMLLLRGIGPLPRRRRRWSAPDDDEPPHAVLPDVEVAVELDVEAQLAALASGTPRNAIVACWLQLEEDVADAGLPRRASETSAEFTTRVLATYSIDESPIEELAALYREARFSRHELGQRERERALAALRRLHDTLRAPRRPLGGRLTTAELA
jgi:hypothetical protein